MKIEIVKCTDGWEELRIDGKWRARTPNTISGNQVATSVALYLRYKMDATYQYVSEQFPKNGISLKPYGEK